MKYRQLYSLTIRHEYYPNGKCPDFTLIPTPECERVIRDFRLLVKYFPFGLKVLTPLKEIEVAGQDGSKTKKIVPFLDIPESVKFSFWMKSDNPDFGAFTDLDKTFSGNSIVNPIFHMQGLPSLGVNISSPKTIELAPSGEYSGRIPTVASNASSLDSFLRVNYEGERSSSQVIIKREDIPGATHAKFDALSQAGQLIIDIGRAQSSINLFSVETLLAEWEKHLEDSGAGADGGFSFKLIELDALSEGAPHVLISNNEQKTYGLNSEYTAQLPADNPDHFLSVKYTGAAPNAEAPRVVIKSETPPGTQAVGLNVNGSIFTISVGADADSVSTSAVAKAWKNNFSPGDFFLELFSADVLRVKELEAFQTDRFVVPENLPDNITIFSVILKNKPFKRPGDLSLDFKLEGPPEVTIDHFKTEPNVMAFAAGQQYGKPINLTYPVRPALPWGVFGRADIHPKVAFDDLSLNTPDADLFIQFRSKAFYWKYYVVSEIGFDNTTPVSAPKQEVKLGENVDKVLDIPFFLEQFESDVLDSNSLVANSDIEKGLEPSEFARLITQLKEIESNLEKATGMTLKTKTRHLLVSKEKIISQKEYEDRLILKLDKSDLDVDKNMAGVQPFKLDVSLRPPKNDEVQVVLIKKPALAV